MKIKFLDKIVEVSKDTLALIPYFQMRDRWLESANINSSDITTSDNNTDDDNIVIERNSDAFILLLGCVVNDKYMKLLWEQSTATKWAYLRQEFDFYGVTLPIEFPQKCDCSAFDTSSKYTNINPCFYNQQILILSILKDRTSSKLCHKPRIPFKLERLDVTLHTLSANFLGQDKSGGSSQKRFLIRKSIDKINEFILEVDIPNKHLAKFKRISDFISNIKINYNECHCFEQSMQYYDFLSELQPPLNRKFNTVITEQCGKIYVTVNLGSQGLFLNEIMRDVHLITEHTIEGEDVEVNVHINGEIISQVKREELRKIVINDGYITTLPVYVYQCIQVDSSTDLKITGHINNVITGFIIKVESKNLQIPVNKIRIYAGDYENSTANIYTEFGLLIKKKMLSRNLYVFDNNIYSDFVSLQNHIFAHYYELILEINTEDYPPPYTLQIVWIYSDLYRYSNGNLYRIFS
jgi:hypothetical protein